MFSLLSVSTRARSLVIANSSGRKAIRNLTTNVKASDPTKLHAFKLSPNDFATHKCDNVPLELEVSEQELLDMYKTMVSIRRLETASDGLYKAKLIRGFCHLSNGQEAVATGIESIAHREDAIITAYRCHGFALTRGLSHAQILAELMGRELGSSKGKGGSMHIFADGFFGGNGIVGAQVPLGAGLAFAHKYKKNNKATFALYGDGASNQGQVFEAYNMAKLWNLPCVFVCENNKYGMGTSAHRSSASTQYYTRGDYIPGIRVNGMDVLAVRQGTAYARGWTEDGHGPIIMEAVTYRYGGHSMSDPGTTYRTRDEVSHMRSTNDPIIGFKSKLLAQKIFDEDVFRAIDKEVRSEVEAAIEEAKKSPEPNPNTLFRDVYAPKNGGDLGRGLTPYEIHSYDA